MNVESITYTNTLGELIAPFLLTIRSTGFFEVHIYLPLMTILAISIFVVTYRRMMLNGTFDLPLRQRYRYVMLPLYFMLCFFFTGAIAVAFKTMILEETDYTEAHWYIPYVSYLHFYIASVSLAYIYLMLKNQISFFSRALSVYIQIGFVGAYLISINRILSEPWVLSDPASGLSGFYMFAIFGILHLDVVLRLPKSIDDSSSLEAPTRLGNTNIEQKQLNTPTSYTSVAKWLHWSMAVLVICMVFYGWSLDDLDDVLLEKRLSYHALGGFLVASLCVLRYLWRASHPPPAFPATLSRSKVIAARVIHSTLYVLMIVVPVTGLLTAVAHEVPVVILGFVDLQDTFSFIGQSDFDLKRDIHALAMHILVVLVIGHVGAAMIHQFWIKDDIVRRMLRRKTL